MGNYYNLHYSKVVICSKIVFFSYISDFFPFFSLQLLNDFLLNMTPTLILLDGRALYMSYILLEYNGAWKLKVEEDFKWIEVDHQPF